MQHCAAISATEVARPVGRKSSSFTHELSFFIFLSIHRAQQLHTGPEVLFKTCVAMKFMDNDDDDEWMAIKCISEVSVVSKV